MQMVDTLNLRKLNNGQRANETDEKVDQATSTE